MALEHEDDAPGWDAATAEVLAVIRAKGEAGVHSMINIVASNL